MIRLATLAVAAWFGSATVLPTDAVAALVFAQGEDRGIVDLSATNPAAVVSKDLVKLDNTSFRQKANSSSALAFSGTAMTPGLAGTVMLDGGDLALADAATVPLPAAVWLFGSAFLGLCWLGRRAGMRGVGMLPKG